jgi:predicted nucleic acid-binding protein
VIRKLVRVGKLFVPWATDALADLTQLPQERAAHRHLVGRCWELRESLPPYNAAYVALAELLDAPLIAADAKLSRASVIRYRVTVCGPPRHVQAKEW